jgi:hypothetical protein
MYFFKRKPAKEISGMPRAESLFLPDVNERFNPSDQSCFNRSSVGSLGPNGGDRLLPACEQYIGEFLFHFVD